MKAFAWRHGGGGSAHRLLARTTGKVSSAAPAGGKRHGLRIGMSEALEVLRLGPISGIRPSYMTATGFAIWRTPARSMAIKRDENRFSCCRSCMRLMICAWFDTSRGEIYPPARTKLGPTDSAPPMPMPWRRPPESWRGWRFMTEGARPTGSEALPPARVSSGGPSQGRRPEGAPPRTWR